MGAQPSAARTRARISSGLISSVKPQWGRSLPAARTTGRAAAGVELLELAAMGAQPSILPFKMLNILEGDVIHLE